MTMHRTTHIPQFTFPVVREILRPGAGAEPPPDRRNIAARQRALVAASLMAHAADRR